MNAAPLPFLRAATAADLPPGWRWLGPDESTASDDMLWDLAKAKWVPISRPFTGLHVRHFTSAIRATAPARPPVQPAPPAPELCLEPVEPKLTRADALAQGYRSFTCAYLEGEEAELQSAIAGLNAKRTPYLIVYVTRTRSGITKDAREIWIPRKALVRSYQQP